MRLALWVLIVGGCRYRFDATDGNGDGATGPRVITQQQYLKASNADAGDQFGYSMALSADGSTLVVGANLEASSSINIGGNQNDNSAPGSGALYVFVRSGMQWTQQAYIKQSDTAPGDRFGEIITISHDGNLLVAGSFAHGSNQGAAYVFTRSGTQWQQEQLLIPTTAEAGDQAGGVSMSADGTTLAIAGASEDSNGTGVNSGKEADNSLTDSGAVWVYARTGTSWIQQAYLKASNPDMTDAFGNSLVFSADGSRLAVGADYEDSASTDPANNAAQDAGAVYVFARSGTTWTQEAYVKPAVIDAGDHFGRSLSLSDDGSVLAVRAPNESSSARGVDGDATNNNAPNSGALDIFTRSGTTWTQTAYIKSLNSDPQDDFGQSPHLTGDGNAVIVGAPTEAGSGRGLAADPTLNDANSAGAVYVLERAGGWHQTAYVKSSNADANDQFGRRLVITPDAQTWAVSALQESGGGRGTNADPNDNSAPLAGAVYAFSWQ